MSPFQVSKSPFKYIGLEDGLSFVEAKYPSLLFKQQLTACVEKIFGLIRDNLKKEISPLLGLCIQVGSSLPSLTCIHTTHAQDLEQKQKIDFCWYGLLNCKSAWLHSISYVFELLLMFELIWLRLWLWNDFVGLGYWIFFKTHLQYLYQISV